MASNRYCSSCNVGCESTNSCNRCNSCEKCNNAACEETCILIQSFCKTTGQSVGSFSFGQCVSSNETFLTKANWNKIITYINNAYAKGRKKSGGSSGLPASDSNDFMTADMFNKVSEALGNLGSSGPSKRVVPNVDIVLGTYFESLESYANSLKYTSSQCDKCNDSCDVTCKECQLCNVVNCGSCDGSCQAHSPSYGTSCESCNTCQSACQYSCQSSCQTSCQSETSDE